MKAQTNEQNDLKFRAIYLSDLRSIIALYHNHELSETYPDQKQKLTEHFGLPLNLAEWNKKIVGYSFVSVDNPESPQVQLRILKEFQEMEIDKKLSQFTSDMHKNAYGLNGQPAFSDKMKVKNSVRKLVDWLNHCD